MTTDSKEIRTEADDILRSGLLSILDRHGEVHMVGSYVLGLMTWRDLDIHVVRENLDVRAFFDLGGEIARLLKPHRMHFRDESTVGTPGLPRGFYWGIYLGDERNGAWKIDIWQTNWEAYELVRRFGDDLSARLNVTNRAVNRRAGVIRSTVVDSQAPMSMRPCSIEAFAMFRDFGRIFTRRRASRNRLFEAKALLSERGAIGRICRRVLETVQQDLSLQKQNRAV